MKNAKLRHIGLLTLGGILLLPAPAFAYLDPGTGNALIYGLISLASVGVYALKSMFYRFTGKKELECSSTGPTKGPSLLIYSEGKNYWGTFRPIVEALIERKVVFLLGL